jgi:hypothetical protein
MVGGGLAICWQLVLLSLLWLKMVWSNNPNRWSNNDYWLVKLGLANKE